MTLQTPELAGSFRALDHRFTIRSDDREFTFAVVAAFGDLVTSPQAHGVEYVVRSHPDGLQISADELELATGVGVDRAIAWIAWHVNQRAVASVQDRLVLHAGAVVLDGITVVAAGESGAGKSTLVTALLCAGASYLTDEAVAVDLADLSVARFAKPLSLHPTSARLVPRELIDADRTDEQLVPVSGFATLATESGQAPGLLTIVRHQPGAGTHFEPMSPAEMIFRLARLTFDFTAGVQRNLTGLAAVAANAACGHLVTDEMIDVADTVRAAADHERTTTGPTPIAQQIDGLVMVELGGEAVIHVISTGALHHLDPISMQVWSTMRHGRSLSDLASELTTRYDGSRDQIDHDLRGVGDRLIDDRILRG